MPRKKLLLLLWFTLYFVGTAQEKFSVTECLKKVEEGDLAFVRDAIDREMVRGNYSAEVLFLEALTTEDANSAEKKYLSLNEKFPSFTYGDAVLFRLIMYYQISGNAEKANIYKTQLRQRFPLSAYTAWANNLPEPSAGEPEEETEKTTVRTPSGVYTVQAAAFIQSNNAVTLQAALDEKGFETEIVQKSVGGTVFHVVYAGSFATEKEAFALSEKLNKEFKLSSKVVFRE